MTSRYLGALGLWGVLCVAGCGSGFSGDGAGGTSGAAGSAGSAGSGASAGSAGHGASAGSGAGGTGAAAGSSGAAGSSPQCAADFCARFDDVPTPATGWDVAEVSGGGHIELVPAASAPSAPNVLVSAVSADSAAFHAARLSLQPSSADYATATPKLELAFSFSAIQADNQTALSSIANVRYGAAEHYLIVALEPVNKSHQLIAYPFPAGEPVVVLGAAKFGSWQTIRMTIPKRSADLGNPVGSGATVELDGSPKTLTLPPAVLTADLRFDLGLAIPSAPAADSVVHFDDVAITWSAP